MHVKSLIPGLQERELKRICNFPYSVAVFIPVYDGKEHDLWRTGAKAPGDCPDSVATDSA